MQLCLQRWPQSVYFCFNRFLSAAAAKTFELGCPLISHRFNQHIIILFYWFILLTWTDRPSHLSWSTQATKSYTTAHSFSAEKWQISTLEIWSAVPLQLRFPCVCVCVCWDRCLLCPTVSKDLMRDLTVAPGSESASPLASTGVVGIMEMPHQWRLLSESDTLTSSPWDLTDTMNRVSV